MVVFTVVCIMVIVVRHLFRHKGSYHTNEAKGADSADCADAAIIVSDPAFTETIEESKKEWFIWLALSRRDAGIYMTGKSRGSLLVKLCLELISSLFQNFMDSGLYDNAAWVWKHRVLSHLISALFTVDNVKRNNLQTDHWK